VVNSLSLNEAELDALRGLRRGTNQLYFADPIWDELQDLGLIAARGARVGTWILTSRGRNYHAKIPECRPHITRGLHRCLYRFSPQDFLPSRAPGLT
jgi:hypothetical protein